MKSLLLAGLLLAGVSVFAAECSYCTRNTRDRNVYLCRKCHQRFCSGCSETSGGNMLMPEYLKCPNCGNKAKFEFVPFIGWSIPDDNRNIKVLKRAKN